MTVRENYEAIKNYLVETKAPEDMIAFVASRIEQDEKAKANAQKKRLEKNGGVKKDPAFSEYYTGLRNAIMNVMTNEAQTGELVHRFGILLTWPGARRGHACNGEQEESAP